MEPLIYINSSQSSFLSFKALPHEARMTKTEERIEIVSNKI